MINYTEAQSIASSTATLRLSYFKHVSIVQHKGIDRISRVGRNLQDQIHTEAVSLKLAIGHMMKSWLDGRMVGWKVWLF